MAPRPKPEHISRLYGIDYFGASSSVDGVGYVHYADEAATLRATADNRLRLIEGHAAVQGKRVLEIGCASGEFCRAVAARGGHAVGIDLSREIIGVAKQRHPEIDFRVGDITAVPPSEQFDVIFGWEVVEHVTSPVAFFTEVARRLKPNGRLVLSTPNYQCARRNGANRWLGFLTSFEHLYFFDVRTLSTVAQRANFSLVSSWTGAGDGLPPSNGLAKRLAREVLRRTGVLAAFRTARMGRLRRRSPELAYDHDQNGHNLVTVFEMPSGSPAV